MAKTWKYSVELSRIGSDPEFSFVTPDQNRKVHLVSAHTLVGDDKDLRLRSFIGTDGHASTAELRPNPCRNVYWHLLKIADGLHEVRNSIRYHSRKMDRPLLAVAQPSLGPSETMGGHIWISFWYKSKLSSDVVHKAGIIYDNDQRDYRRSNQQRPIEPDQMPTRLSQTKLQQYIDLAQRGEELSLDLCWKKLHYLIHPLEMMLYGKVRTDRTSPHVRDHYIRTPDLPSEADQAMFRPGWAYFRFEYRIPSTWLQHPTLAFAYLGLAKLAMLNWDLLPNWKILSTTFALDTAGTSPLDADGWRKKLQERYTWLTEHPDYRATRDLNGLGDALNALYNVELSFPALIHFDAWESLKPPTYTRIPEEGDD